MENYGTVKHCLVAALLTLGIRASAQDLAVSTPTEKGISQFDRQRIDALDQGVQDLLTGRPTVTGLPTYKNGIKFGDGTTQTTAYVVSSSSLQVRYVNETALSSTTYANTSSANAGNCVVSAGTFTVTLTASQYVEVSLSGNISNSVSVQDNTFYLEQNGAIPSPYDTTPGFGTGKKNFTNCYTPTSAQMYQCHGRVILNPGAGTFSYCVGGFTQSGTLSLTGMQFSVKIL